MLHTLTTLLHQLQRFDRQRSGMPGEHWASFGAGLTMLNLARRSPSPVFRAVVVAAGVALIWRAASGRDGPVARLRRR